LNGVKDPAGVIIDRDPSFGVQLPVLRAAAVKRVLLPANSETHAHFMTVWNAAPADVGRDGLASFDVKTSPSISPPWELFPIALRAAASAWPLIKHWLDGQSGN
jgi:hypothetical protein